MRNIIITGGRGLLATELTRRLLADGDCNLYLVSRSPQDIQPADHLHAIELGQLVDDKALRGLNYDAVVHTAFARGNDGRELFASLSYTEALLQAMRRLDVKSFINVSSQGIYGPDNHGVMWKETSRVAPGYPYTIAKSFSEVLTDAHLSTMGVTHTNVRLASIAQNARFLHVFVEKALAGEAITVMGGTQRYSFIDVRDAAEGLITLLNNPGKQWRRVYNLGPGQSHALIDIASTVQKIARGRCGHDVVIDRQPSDVKASVGMDISCFIQDFSWTPHYTLEDSINHLFSTKET